MIIGCGSKGIEMARMLAMMSIASGPKGALTLVDGQTASPDMMQSHFIIR